MLIVRVSFHDLSFFFLFILVFVGVYSTSGTFLSF